MQGDCIKLLMIPKEYGSDRKHRYDFFPLILWSLLRASLLKDLVCCLSISWYLLNIRNLKWYSIVNFFDFMKSILRLFLLFHFITIKIMIWNLTHIKSIWVPRSESYVISSALNYMGKGILKCESCMFESPRKWNINRYIKSVQGGMR
jgi:hypothetical protein